MKFKMSLLFKLDPGAWEFRRAVMEGAYVLSQVVSGTEGEGAFGQLLLSSAVDKSQLVCPESSNRAC